MPSRSIVGNWRASLPRSHGVAGATPSMYAHLPQILTSLSAHGDCFTLRRRRLIVHVVDLAQLAVIVMAKYPTPGRVKTRLMPILNAAQAAEVQKVFLVYVIRRLAGLKPAELVVCYDPPDSLGAMQELLRNSMTGDRNHKPTWLAQCGGDLGDRLADAASHMGKRHSAMLFFGVDSPDVPLNHIAHAAELAMKHPISLSPTDDGGYWSLGVSGDVPLGRMLKGVPWSSGREAEETLRRAEDMGYHGVLGKGWDDVDRPEDLRRLIVRLKMSASRSRDEAASLDDDLCLDLLRRLGDVWDDAGSP